MSNVMKYQMSNLMKFQMSWNVKCRKMSNVMKCQMSNFMKCQMSWNVKGLIDCKFVNMSIYQLFNLLAFKLVSLSACASWSLRACSTIYKPQSCSLSLPNKLGLKWNVLHLFLFDKVLHLSADAENDFPPERLSPASPKTPHRSVKE